MTELSEKLFNILTDISRNLEYVPFWKDYDFWSVAVSGASVAVLIITLRWLIRYTRATEKMTEYQIIPAIDVNMIYDPQKKKTYFWFSNSSKIPALVSMEISFTFQKDPYPIGPYRIPPKVVDKPTAPTFFDKSASGSDRYHTEGVGAVILVRVKPDIEDASLEIGVNFKKSYNFHENKWDEKTWGGPDPQSSLYNEYYKEV